MYYFRVKCWWLVVLFFSFAYYIIGFWGNKSFDYCFEINILHLFYGL